MAGRKSKGTGENMKILSTVWTYLGLVINSFGCPWRPSKEDLEAMEKAEAKRARRAQHRIKEFHNQ